MRGQLLGRQTEWREDLLHDKRGILIVIKMWGNRPFSTQGRENVMRGLQDPRMNGANAVRNIGSFDKWQVNKVEAEVGEEGEESEGKGGEDVEEE